MRWAYLYYREQNPALASRLRNWNSGFCTSSRRSHRTTSFPEPPQMAVPVLPLMAPNWEKKGTSMSMQHLARHLVKYFKKPPVGCIQSITYTEWDMVHFSHSHFHFENNDKKEALRTPTMTYITNTWQELQLVFSPAFTVNKVKVCLQNNSRGD